MTGRRVAGALLLAAAATLAAPRAARAHALEPSLLELRETTGDRVAVTWTTPATGVPGVVLRPVLPDGCRAATSPTVVDAGDRFVVRWEAVCGEAGLVGRHLAVEGLGAARTDALVRIALRDGRVVQAVLSGDVPALLVPERPRALDVLHDYVRLGLHHILTGWDHLLFVLGLLLLVGGGSRLLATVTAFTAGHSVTLSLAVLGVVHVPQPPVEVAIAASVYVLAVELARASPARRPSLLARRPWLVAAAFGLLHGLGFAGALSAAGLPDGDVPLALAGFNAGIEAGQLAVVGAALAAGRLLAGLAPRLAVRTRLAPAYAIGTLAAFWVVQRAVALAG